MRFLSLPVPESLLVIHLYFYPIHTFYKVIHQMLLSISHAFHLGVLSRLIYYIRIKMLKIIYSRILFGILHRIHEGVGP